MPLSLNCISAAPAALNRYLAATRDMSLIPFAPLFHQAVDPVVQDHVGPGELGVEHFGGGADLGPGDARGTDHGDVGADPGLESAQGGGGDAERSERGDVRVRQVVDLLGDVVALDVRGRTGDRRSLMLLALGHLPAGFDCVRHQHRDCHRPDAARHRGDGGNFFGHFIKRDIADQTITAFRRRVVHSIDADVDHDCAVANMFRSDKVRLPDRRDQDVGGTRDVRETLAARMNHRDGRVTAPAFPHQQKCERLSDNHAAAENDDVGAGDFDSAFDEQSLAAERRARNKSALIAQRELRDVHRMETIHVFRRIQRAHDGRLIDVLRRWRLNENAVDRPIAIQLFDPREQFGLGGLGRQFQLHRMQPEIAAHLVFRAHIRARSRIIAHQHHGEARSPAPFL